MPLVRKRLSPQCSCTSGAPGLRACSMSATTGSASRVELDLGGEVLGLGARRRDAHGDQLADVAHLARGEHRLQRRLEARQRGIGADGRHAGQVLGDEHATADCPRDADARDARMRQRAAQERHLLHARQPDVADILPAAAHVAVVLLAAKPGARRRFWFRFWFRSWSSRFSSLGVCVAHRHYVPDRSKRSIRLLCIIVSHCDGVNAQSLVRVEFARQHLTLPAMIGAGAQMLARAMQRFSVRV